MPPPLTVKLRVLAPKPRPTGARNRWAPGDAINAHNKLGHCRDGGDPDRCSRWRLRRKGGEVKVRGFFPPQWVFHSQHSLGIVKKRKFHYPIRYRHSRFFRFFFFTLIGIHGPTDSWLHVQPRRRRPWQSDRMRNRQQQFFNDNANWYSLFWWTELSLYLVFSVE